MRPEIQAVRRTVTRKNSTHLGNYNRLINQIGKTITPTPRGAILALQSYCNSKKPPSVRQIPDQLQVSKSAVHSIGQHAVKKAHANRIASGTSNGPIPTPVLPRTLTTDVLSRNIKAATGFLD